MNLKWPADVFWILKWHLLEAPPPSSISRLDFITDKKPLLSPEVKRQYFVLFIWNHLLIFSKFNLVYISQVYTYHHWCMFIRINCKIVKNCTFIFQPEEKNRQKDWSWKDSYNLNVKFSTGLKFLQLPLPANSFQLHSW